MDISLTWGANWYIRQSCVSSNPHTKCELKLDYSIDYPLILCANHARSPGQVSTYWVANHSVKQMIESTAITIDIFLLAVVSIHMVNV